MTRKQRFVTSKLWRRVQEMHRRLDASVGVLVVRRGKEMELMPRALGFAALGFLTLVPLLILVAAVDPGRGLGAGQWLGTVLGVSSTSQREIAELFGAPSRALQRTTVFGFVVLSVFGLFFGSALQTGYERVWDLPAAKWHVIWRHVIWLAVFVGYLVLSIKTHVRSASATETAFAALSDVVVTFVFFLWSQRFLLCDRVRWRALLPGSVGTALGLVGLRVFSQLVFSPLIASNAVTYGPFGTVLIIQSWLVGVGFVVYGGPLLGRAVHEERIERRIRGGG